MLLKVHNNIKIKGRRESELYLRFQHLLTQSKCSQHFMESESSLPYTQQLATCLYPEPAQSSAPRLPISFQTLNIYIYIFVVGSCHLTASAKVYLQLCDIFIHFDKIE
jgi:hypothetical protein